MADEYKALTVVNLPFIDQRYDPGQMIPHTAFEEYAAEAAAQVDDVDGNVPTAQEVIDQMIEYGSISEDPDAPLHPDHLPVSPGAPTTASLVEQAKLLVEDLKARGQEVPAEIQALADQVNEHRSTEDAAQGGDA